MQAIFRSGVLASALAAGLAPTATAQTPETRTTTLSERGINGTVGTAEQIVEHREQTRDGEQVTIDVYSPSIEAGRLALTRRIRRVTTATSDGSRTVEETEEHNAAAPGDTMRLVWRCVTTVRRTGPDSAVTERQIFERDVNGRLLPIRSEIELTSGR